MPNQLNKFKIDTVFLIPRIFKKLKFILENYFLVSLSTRKLFSIK